MNKKGVAMQLHWIFILIAGGIILAFFFSIASKQKVLSDEKLSLSLVHSVDMIFEMAESSESTSQIISLPKKGVFFLCSKDCDCYLQTGNARKSFGSNIIFADSVVDSAQAVVWSLPWKVPFRAANILYVANPETRRIIVYDESPFADSLLQSLKNVLPENIFFEIMSSADYGSIGFDGSDLTKVIFVGNTATSAFIADSLKDENVNLISINPKNIAFYNVDKLTALPKEIIGYPADITWILAAFFSSDYDMFICGMKSAFKRLNVIANVFHKRSSILANETSREGMNCWYPVDEINDIVDKTSNMDSKTAGDLHDLVNDVKIFKGRMLNKNNQLIQQSCPELF